jgi:hypothetical protein
MKTILSILTAMVFALSFGLAFADEWPVDQSGKFIGTELRDEAFPVQQTEVRMGAAAGGVREEKTDKSNMIWKSLFGAPKGTDLPDPYRGFFKHEKAVGAGGAAAGGYRAEAAGDKGSVIYDSLLGPRGGTTDIAY